MWFWLFLLSAMINVIAILYVRWLLKTVATINEDISNLDIIVSNFSEHTKSVYELEMFYGDETLKGLMDHARELSDRLKDLDLVLNEEGEDVAEETTPEN